MQGFDGIEREGEGRRQPNFKTGAQSRCSRELDADRPTTVAFARADHRERPRNPISWAPDHGNFRQNGRPASANVRRRMFDAHSTNYRRERCICFVWITTTGNQTSKIKSGLSQASGPRDVQGGSPTDPLPVVFHLRTCAFGRRQQCRRMSLRCGLAAFQSPEGRHQA